MSRNKYDITDALAKRVAKALNEEPFYFQVVAALRAENVYVPERSVRDLIRKLGVINPSLARHIGAESANEAYRAREALWILRSGLGRAMEYFDRNEVVEVADSDDGAGSGEGGH